MNGMNLESDGARTQDSNVAEASAATAAPVLLAVDFSQDCCAALVWACEYAAVTGAPLEILHVVHDPAHAPGRYRSDATDPLEPIADVAERKLADFVEQARRDNPELGGLESATRLCVAGLPAQKIVDVADARGARLLVMGGGRHNGFERFVRGSTANQIARNARVPVTVVRSGS